MRTEHELKNVALHTESSDTSVAPTSLNSEP